MENFFSNLTLPKPNDEQKSDLNKSITLEEVNEAIRSLQSGKAPGPDGFSSEFFKQFTSLMVKPLLNVFNHSLETGALPKTLTEANISLILKRDKPGDECSSYRPISLLNIDFKILSKTLALRLEKILPHIINNDQTGFITGRNSCNNVRRLLNIIQQKHLKGMVMSLDAEKALEWDFLFFTLKEFGLDENFIDWVRLLYYNPMAAIITNGRCSPCFTLGRGTRQGCPLSPLLFAIAIEPLVESIRTHPNIHGISVNQKQHRISLYADDVLLFITRPEISVAAVLNIINQFSEFSGYKINFNKSEAMPLSQVHHTLPPGLSPFRWATQGFIYLGIFVTPVLQNMYKTNCPDYSTNFK